MSDGLVVRGPVLSVLIVRVNVESTIVCSVLDWHSEELVWNFYLRLEFGFDIQARSLCA